MDDVFQVSNGQRVVAQVIRTAGASDEVTYVYSDHVGSTDAVQTGNNAVQAMKYDPFGNRLSMQGPRDMRLSASPSSTATSGFTGHEMEDESGTVNMGGRIYDARLGRFLQADLVTALSGSQGLNRYSYVANNPLRYTDPSGMTGQPYDCSGYATDHYGPYWEQRTCFDDSPPDEESNIAADNAWFEDYNDTAYEVNGTIYQSFADAARVATAPRDLSAEEAKIVDADLQRAKAMVDRAIQGLEDWAEGALSGVVRHNERSDP